MPVHRLAIHGEFNGEVIRPEPAVRAGRVCQRKGAGFDDQLLTRVRHFVFEPRHRQAPIEKHERSVILKLAVRRPLHADQLGREHGKPRFAQGYNGSGVGQRIGRGSSDFLRCGGAVCCLSVRSGRQPKRPSDCESHCGKVFQRHAHRFMLDRYIRPSVREIAKRHPLNEGQ